MSRAKKPVTEQVLARDVVPYEWAQWCSIEDSLPFSNDVVSVRPSDCGTYLWFMLETWNFFKAKPDEELELIPLLPLAEEIP